ncbi:MAG: DUF59 domain-containing protein [Opitutales bacterium]|nr:DUF59 domain-containing protein [Opitutales bacterium]
MDGQIEISRDCDALLIPSGTEAKLAKGTKIVITHKLGGNFTVSGAFGMARILGKDADAIGEPVPAQNPDTPKPNPEFNEYPQDETAPAESASKTDFDPPDESELWDAARTVYDPEIPLNIVELGLVYKMDLIRSPEGKYAVEADMTLTAPGCAMGPIIADDLKMRLKAIPGIDDAIVNIVWDPPWSQDMITEEGKMTLGLL